MARALLPPPSRALSDHRPRLQVWYCLYLSELTQLMLISSRITCGRHVFQSLRVYAHSGERLTYLVTQMDLPVRLPKTHLTMLPCILTLLLKDAPSISRTVLSVPHVHGQHIFGMSAHPIRIRGERLNGLSARPSCPITPHNVRETSAKHTTPASRDRRELETVFRQ